MPTSIAPLEELERLDRPTEAEVLSFLRRHVPQHRTWGKGIDRSKPVSRLITETVNEQSSVLALVRIYDTFLIPLRILQTVTLRVTRLSPPGMDGLSQLSKKVLRELHFENEEMVPRRHRNSMSEKLTVGEWGGDHVQVVVRALREELGISAKEEHLRSPYLYSVPPGERESDISLSTEGYPEFGIEKGGRYPGLLKHNPLHHFIWEMPDEYYVAYGYHELDTNHYFKWDTRFMDND